MQNNIVVWDPQNEYWEGALVSNDRAREIEQRGVCVMPVDTSLFAMSGAGGFFKRAWGSGWPLDHATPRHFANMTIFSPTGDPDGRTPRKLHWRARLARAPGYDGTLDAGFVRLTADTAQISQHRLGLGHGPHDITMIAMKDIGAADKWGGWTVGGAASVLIRDSAHYPLSLYGMQRGIRLVWAAVSLGA